MLSCFFNKFSFIAAELVAQFKYTVLLFPNGIQLLTGSTVSVDCYDSEHNLSEEMKTLVSSELKLAEESKKPKDKKPRKPKKGKADKTTDDKENAADKTESKDSVTTESSVASETKAN